MDGICEVKLNLAPLAMGVAADVEAARQDDTPGGKTITTEERDAIEQRAHAALTAAGTELLQVPHPCTPLAAGLLLHNAGEMAKGIVKRIIDGPTSAPNPGGGNPAPAPSTPAEPAPSIKPVRPRGRVIDA